jgi:hypothetical protein
VLPKERERLSPNPRKIQVVFQLGPSEGPSESRNLLDKRITMDEARRKVETPPALGPVQGVKRGQSEIIEVDLAASESVEAI